MRQKPKRIISLFLCIITLILPLAIGSNADLEVEDAYADAEEPQNAAAAASTVTVILDSSSKYVEANADFTIDVYLESTTAIAGAQLMFTYDNTKATLKSYAMGTQFTAESVTGEGVSHFKHDETNHTLKFVAVASAATGYTDAAVKTGYAIRLTFTAKINLNSTTKTTTTMVLKVDIEDASQYSALNIFDGFTTVGDKSANKISIDNDTVTNNTVLSKRLVIRKVKGYMVGDVDRSGSIRSADITIILRYLANYKTYQSDYSEYVYLMDVNGDGVVRSADITLLKRYLANFDITLY